VEDPINRDFEELHLHVLSDEDHGFRLLVISHSPEMKWGECINKTPEIRKHIERLAHEGKPFKGR